MGIVKKYPTGSNQISQEGKANLLVAFSYVATIAQGLWLYGWKVADVTVKLAQEGYTSHSDDGVRSGEVR